MCIRDRVRPGHHPDFDLVGDERFHRLHLLLALTMATCKLVDWTAGKEYTCPVCVRRHKKRIAIRNLKRCEGREPLVTSSPPRTIHLRLMHIGEGRFLGLPPRIVLLLMSLPCQLHTGR